MLKRGLETPGVGVGALVHDYRGNLLLLQRKSEFGNECWGLPGGWLELGETPQQAAQREVREETGLEVVGTRIVGVTNDFHPEGVHSVTLFVSCKTTPTVGQARVMEPHKAFAVAWVSFHDLGKAKRLFLPLRQFVESNALWDWMGGGE